VFFGLSGSLNDINILDRSPIFQELYEDRAPTCEYVVNGHKYYIGYYLSDGIYPKWSTFVKTIPFPQGPKAKLFAKRQESVRKDVDRGFGVLQARFAIVCGPTRLMDEKEIGIVMQACVILLNLILRTSSIIMSLHLIMMLWRGPPRSQLLTMSIIHATKSTFKERQSFVIPKLMHVFKRA